MRYTALMVVVDRDFNENYIVVPIHDYDGEIPENNPEDITRIVSICNNAYSDDDYRFVDMFGIIKDGNIELWEEIDCNLDQILS